jgi:hypothetical protein
VQDTPRNVFRRTRIGMHFGFWAIVIVLNLLNNASLMDPAHPVAFVVKHAVQWLPFIALSSVNAFFLIPRLHHPAQTGRYFAALLLLWLLGTPVQMEVFNQINTAWGELAYENNVPAFSMAAYLLSFIFLAIGTLLSLSLKSIEGLYEIDRLRNMQAQTELSLLKQQIHPHFFFNTLNNLHALALERSEKSPELILCLSEMMRYSLRAGTQDTVPLYQEVAHVEHFLSLQRIRLHYPADILFEKKYTSLDIQMPPLTLITFVENAFKHGVDSLDTGAFVHILLHTSPTELVFEVSNNCGPQTEPLPTGMGLSNLRRRLEIGCPMPFNLETQPQGDRFFAKLTLYLS